MEKLVTLTRKERKFWDDMPKTEKGWELLQAEFTRLQKYDGMKDKDIQHLDTHRVDTLKLTKVIGADLKESWEIHLNGALIGKGYTDLSDAISDYEAFRDNVKTGKVSRTTLRQDEICTLVKR